MINDLFKYDSLKRLFDILFSTIGIVVFFIPVLVTGIIIRFSSKGDILHKAYRVGKGMKPFKIYKLRTMSIYAPVRSFESLKKPEKFYVQFGKVLRLSGFDELPQLYNVFKGEMSFVGPRPTLFDQTDLISLREENNIYSLLPGITGYAQINGRSQLSAGSKVLLDLYYLNNISYLLDIEILIKTIPCIYKDLLSSNCNDVNGADADETLITELKDFHK